MFEEPYRWMEAISTRHNYVQEKLKMGRPVIAVPYNERFMKSMIVLLWEG